VAMELSTDWGSLKEAEEELLINSLSMLCPFAPEDKQALLEALVCPVTQGPLAYDAEAGTLVSRAAGLAFPIRDGIPIMLASEAREI
jgi:uncharacterized protein YbaR (Trm112 family)